jgi:hypothetical protein
MKINEQCTKDHTLKKCMKNYVCFGKCTNEINHRISLCRFDDVVNYFGLFNVESCYYACTNTFINGIKCSILNPSPILKFKYTSKSDYFIDFYDMITFEQMLKCKQMTIMQPIYCNIMGERHVMLLIINKKTKFINILDTNCEHTYSILFENVVRRVISKSNERGKYFVRRITYPKTIATLHFKSSNKHGICVQIILLIAHSILISDMTAQNVINQIDKLNAKEWNEMMNGHALFYYSIITNI